MSDLDNKSFSAPSSVHNENQNTNVKTQTVYEAKKWLNGMMNTGVTCPCCGQYAKMYRRKITSTMAKCLVMIHRFFQHNKVSFIHVPNYLVKVKNDGSVAGGDVAKLKHWGLLEPVVNERADGSKRAGFYRITQLGKDWADGKVEIPKYAYIYNQKLYKLSDEKVFIKDALGDRFDYRELMSA